MSAPSLARAQAGGRTTVPVWLLVFITLSGTLGMHMFVPALPQAALDLGTSPAAMQMTISLYIAGLGVGQLVYGPLSDAYGRRPLLLGGLALYTVAGVAAALSSGVHALIAARLLQALGGCAGLVLGRAIVRDSAGAGDALRKLALLNLMTLFGPGLAPMVGGFIGTHAGWRTIFLALATLGGLALVCSARLLPETARPTGKMSTARLVHDYGLLLRSPIFAGFALGGGAATTAFYAFLAAAPFVFTVQLHRPIIEVGIYLAVLMVGVCLGNTGVARLSRSVPVDRLLMSANLLSLCSAAALLAVAVSGHLSVPAVVGLMFLFTVGAGASSPVALAKAISVDPRLTGSAAGFYGFAQMAIGALCTALVSLGDDPAVSAGVVLTLMAVVGRVAFTIATRKARQAQAAAGAGVA